jgi:hypothetical protein
LSASPNPSSFPGPGSPIAGSVLPIRRAEELLATLPGVLSAKIVATDSGAVDEIHLLTSAEFAPKQTVRNVESALLAHLGLRVDHRKISVATTTEASRVAATAAAVDPDLLSAVVPEARGGSAIARRRLYFEDVEVRRSRARGITCRVTLRKADSSYVGESDGPEAIAGGEGGGTDRGRVEIAARATLKAIGQAERGDRVLALEGATLVTAFGRSFVFVGIAARVGRVTALLTGSCEVRENPETAGVLAVLDATNRWIAYGK